MELRWLEDYLEIVATRNFSTAAAARNISQPAFSRRIKALEAWIGTDLVDRSTYPVQLTKAGELFLPRCQEIIRDLYRLRADCQQQSDQQRQLISFSALHTIALFFFPEWVSTVEVELGSVHMSMHATDFHDCIEHLALGWSHFAIAYDHPDGPPVLRDGPFHSLRIGVDPLIPVSAVGPDGQPLFTLDPPKGQRVPYLAYSWNDGYVGRLISLILARQDHDIPLSTVYETSIAEGIKRMAMAEKGVGWLPLSCVKDAIARGDLCQIGGPELTIDMEVRIFRRHGPAEPELEAFWEKITKGPLEEGTGLFAEAKSERQPANGWTGLKAPVSRRPPGV